MQHYRRCPSDTIYPSKILYNYAYDYNACGCVREHTGVLHLNKPVY